MVFSSSFLCDNLGCFHYFAVPYNVPLCFCLVGGVLFRLVPSCRVAGSEDVSDFTASPAHVTTPASHSPAEGVLTALGILHLTQSNGLWPSFNLHVSSYE